MKRQHCGAILLFATLVARADIRAADLALQQGRADEAIRLLQATLAQESANAQAHQLLCRVFLSEELADPAIMQCEQAVAQRSGDRKEESLDQMWLGRAYGLKADKAGPLTGLSLAKKVRAAFERAVELDPTNVPAAAALGEFYVAAPSIIGGGLDKAQRLATQIGHFFPTAAHRLQAMANEKAKDYAAAEVEFRFAATTGRTPDNWVDLADFYQRRKQPDKAVEALHAALDADSRHDAALADVASILTAVNRDPALAESILRQYLASPNKSEAAPACKVHVQLGQLLSKRGDLAAARAEYTAALDLASAYAPARKALGRP